MDLKDVLNFRRSVRVYEAAAIAPLVVKRCIELATLAPNSSNMQLWEAYHITSPHLIQQMAKACLGQSSVSTASQLVVFVTRQDLHRRRAKANIAFEKENIRRNSPVERQEKRINDRLLYYGKLMPFLYGRFFGILGLIRKVGVSVVGLFRPIVYQVSENDIRIVVHKSCALAAQTFMTAMANERYDTCPLEGFDSKRVKKLLQLPYGAEINMVVSCGIRKGDEGIWGDRFRVPFEEVYHSL
ncbi:nitroreductase family protein [Sphingobacterium bambusae]|uniref:Nitroreductase family protein n=1 Tax=Sphingobacterium bambusae TaxID=662858 RepID=A0ABW6BKB6_9SPHI|nr:nitroreductase family protein [Sphingobacterium bambusae]WPL47884.1 nitroreductase family protein [Sphingobacterium bambusae]